MAKYLILFGAGASHGSDDPSFTPPLGGLDLFNALVSFNPNGWGKLTQQQQIIFANDFEKGMESISKSHPAIMPPLQRTMAEYFFGFKPRNTNLYYDLAKKIAAQNWDGCLATLNYEQLLTIALNTTGNKPFIGKKDKAESKEIEICIPHGTCNVFCTSVIAHTTTQFANCTVDGPIKILSEPAEFKKEIINNAVPPVMSYFTPSKETMSGVTFIENQRKRLKELIEQASVIGIIGIRARLHDVHIWAPLSKTNASIIFCSGKSAGDEFREWCETNRGDKNNDILPGYFKDSFDELCSKLGLN